MMLTFLMDIGTKSMSKYITLRRAKTSGNPEVSQTHLAVSKGHVYLYLFYKKDKYNKPQQIPKKDLSHHLPYTNIIILYSVAFYLSIKEYYYINLVSPSSLVKMS